MKIRLRRVRESFWRGSPHLALFATVLVIANVWPSWPWYYSALVGAVVFLCTFLPLVLLRGYSRP